MQFIFVEFWVTLEIILHGVNDTGISFFVFKLSGLIELFSSTLNIFPKKKPVFYGEESIMQVLCF